jgi:hypothetical protein
MKSVILLFVVALALFVSGCATQTITKYQCQNGQAVDNLELCSSQKCPDLDYSKCPQQKCPDLDCSTCPKQIETKTVTKYQCQDGSIKDSASECSKTLSQQADESGNCIEILQHSDRRNQYGWLVISGTVKNKCSYQSTGTIHFLLYDSNRHLVTSDYTHADPWQMPAGATEGFEQTWTDETVYSKVKSYDISASAD